MSKYALSREPLLIEAFQGPNWDSWVAKNSIL